MGIAADHQVTVTWPSNDPRIGIWCGGQVTVTWLLMCVMWLCISLPPDGEQNWGDSKVTVSWPSRDQIIGIWFGGQVTITWPSEDPRMNWYLVWGSSDCHVTVCLSTPSGEQSWGDGQVTVTWPSCDRRIVIWCEGQVTVTWLSWAVMWHSHDPHTRY